MANRTSPTNCAKIVGIQRLNQTLAAQDVADAKSAESKAQERCEALERLVEESVGAWSSHLASRSVDPDHLQRLALMISNDVRQAASATTDLNRATDEAETRSRRLEVAGANLKQAEELNRKIARQAARKAEEDFAHLLEERISFTWGRRR